MARNRMESILRGLNAAQRAAVTSSASVLQVLAPPGSGKTKTLTSRVAYLLAHHGYAPWDVICCTFTIKASREMRERLQGMVGGELESKLVLGTFHSICRRYLVSYGHLIGIPKNFGIADSDDSLNIIKRAVKRLKLGIDPKSARSRISHRKARGKRFDDLPKTVKNIEAQEFSTICQEYEQALNASNLLDYDDLLIRCVELLRKHPECVSNIEALLIDEFQDTNVVQFELMKLLASARKRITIVGDPDQSIYGFRSAEIENLRRMKAYYPETVVINLEENYRSSSAVLKLAQEVIEQDNDRPDKKLKSTHRYGTLPVLRRLPNPHEEAHWIVSEIKRITSMTGNLVQHGDIAILLRSAFLSLLIEKALANAAIPYRMVGGRRFFDRVEVRILLDYLRTISHPDNTSALLSIINTPTRKIGDTTVKELTRVAEVNKESLWSVIQKVLSGKLNLDKKLAKPAEQGLSELISLIKKARQKMDSMIPQDTPGKLIEHVIVSLRYQDYLKRQYRDDHEERWENVQELLTQATDASLLFNAPADQLPQIDGVVQAQAQGAQEVLAQFLANVVLSTEKDSDDGEEKPRVTISTIHSAKGLEWPVVFVPAIYEGSIPHSRAEDTNEERRLLYVALTRAQALLYMTFPVMQSRDENESVLTQFLPSKVNHLVSQTGPAFSDKVVEDIATILRRSPPSQEDLVNGLQAVKENDSQLDDIWPVDGSHKRAHLTEREYPTFMLQQGQSLSDALRSSGPYNQKSQFSTLTYSTSTTMTELTTISTAGTASAFTTASHHLKTLPQLPEKASIKPTLMKSASESTSYVTKKPAIARSVSGQGSIASFFTNSDSKLAQHKLNSIPGSFKQEIIAHPHVLPPVSLSKTRLNRSTSASTVSPDLLDHKLPGANTTLKRPRCVLDTTTMNNSNQVRKRNFHSHLSSSPTHDVKSTDSARLDETENQDSIYNPGATTATAIASNKLSAIVSCNAFQPVPTPLHTVNVSTKIASQSSLHTTSMSMLSSNSQSSEISALNRHTRLIGLNTLQGLQHPSAVGSGIVSALGNASQGRKTLGVRRTMNGWDNRKNK